MLLPRMIRNSLQGISKEFSRSSEEYVAVRRRSYRFSSMTAEFYL